MSFCCADASIATETMKLISKGDILQKAAVLTKSAYAYMLST